MKWLKFYGQDWLTDLKVRSMSPEDRLCFITLLCLASSADEEGLIKHCSEEAIIGLTNLQDNPYDDDNYYNRAKGCLKRYEALQIVTLADNGDVTVCNFGRRQSENLSNAERQKNYRERRKITIKPRNKSNVTRYNDSNARIEENRIEENRVNNTSPEATKVAYSEGDLILAKHLLEKIKHNNPTLKEPDVGKWADQVRLMREKDNRTEDQIRFLIDWSQKDTFWQSNILSMSKLREKFDTLVAQVKRKSGEQSVKKSKIAFT